MINFVTVSHKADASQQSTQFHRAEHQSNPLDFFDSISRDERLSANRLHKNNWTCRTLSDFRFMERAVQREPLQAWEHAKRFGAQGALIGSGAGLLLGIGLGLTCWPLALVGGVLAGTTSGHCQYSALESAERFDRAIIGLGTIARSAQVDASDIDTLQDELAEFRQEFAGLGPAFDKLVKRLDDLLEEGKKNPDVFRMKSLYS